MNSWSQATPDQNQSKSLILWGCITLKWMKPNGFEGSRVNNFVELWCLMASRSLEIWLLATSFLKSTIGWPQQPMKERVPDICKELDVWWSILQKGNGFDHLGARDDLSGPRRCWSCRVYWDSKDCKAWKITNDCCRVIQVPEFIFILMTWKPLFFGRIVKYQIEFCHLLSWRLLRPVYVTFLKTGW